MTTPDDDSMEAEAPPLADWPEAVRRDLERLIRERRSGSLTINFQRGSLATWETRYVERPGQK